MRTRLIVPALALVILSTLTMSCSFGSALMSQLPLAAVYAPPAEIVALADEATMTDSARSLFYAAQPLVESDRASFEQHCHAPVSNNLAELGCYTSDNRIYILRISDTQLSSEMAVVAAHEMLHAAYAQLSEVDRAAINTQLETAVARIHDADLSQRLQAYRALEPGARDDELHSILGTEFAPLSSSLDQYYGRYFTDRAAIAADAQNFDRVFMQVDNSVATLRSQIARLRTQMQGDLRHGRLSEYNALVPQFNALIQHYRQAVTRHNAISSGLYGEEPTAASQ